MNTEGCLLQVSELEQTKVKGNYRLLQTFQVKSDRYNYFYERVENDVLEPDEDPLQTGHVAEDLGATKMNICEAANDAVCQTIATEDDQDDQIDITEWKPCLCAEEGQNLQESSYAEGGIFLDCLRQGFSKDDVDIDNSSSKAAENYTVDSSLTMKWVDSNQVSCAEEKNFSLQAPRTRDKKKGIALSISRKNEKTGGIIYDKVHSCLFCKKKIDRLVRHLKYYHEHEGRVKSLLALPLNSRERKNGIVLLAREGDYYHNCRVLESNEGELILTRRPGKLKAKCLNPNDYQPCPQCLGFVSKKVFWKHKKLCSLRSKSQPKTPTLPGILSGSFIAKSNSHGSNSSEEENCENGFSDFLHKESRTESVSNICKELIVRISPLPKIYDGISSNNEDDFSNSQKKTKLATSLKIGDQDSLDVSYKTPDECSRYDYLQEGIFNVNDKNLCDSVINHYKSSPLQANDSNDAVIPHSNIALDKTDNDHDAHKVHRCLFCHRKIVKIIKHLQHYHKYEERVKALMALPMTSKVSLDGFSLLVREGDYWHNCRVLESNEGELILMEHPSKCDAESLKPNDYHPCHICLGFFLKKRIFCHEKQCNGQVESSWEDSAAIEEEDSFIFDGDSFSDEEDNVEASETSKNEFFKSTNILKKSTVSSSSSENFKPNSCKDGLNTNDSSNVVVNGYQSDLSSSLKNSTGSKVTHSDDEACRKEVQHHWATPQKEKKKIGIALSLSRKNPKTGGRIFDKVHSCLFCRAKIYSIARHLKFYHKDEDRVKSLMALPKNSKERMDGLALLLREGDYHYNCRVLESNEGELILARRPSKREAKNLKPSDYEPCPRCLGFFMKINMWKHRKMCPQLDRNKFKNLVTTAAEGSNICDGYQHSTDCQKELHENDVENTSHERNEESALSKGEIKNLSMSHVV